MELKKFVLHQLIKEEGEVPLENYSDELLDIEDEAVLEFVEKFLKAYDSGRKKPTYGVFEENEDEYPFQKYIKKYLDDSDFYTFSIRAMEGLKKAIKDSSFAKGGYVIFFHYVEKQNDFIVTTMLDNKTGFRVNKLNLKKIKTLNYNELLRANRVNLKRWDDWNLKTFNNYPVKSTSY